MTTPPNSRLASELFRPSDLDVTTQAPDPNILWLRQLLEWKKELEVEQLAHTRNASFQRAESVFDFVTLFVPKRLADEEIGDALEVIQREIAADRPRWLIRLRVSLKVTSTLFWISINALRHAKGAFSKAKSGGERSS